MSKLIFAVLCLSLLVAGASAEQKKSKRVQQPTAQESLEEFCRENDLGWIETPVERAQYYKECAVRPGKVERFWATVDEFSTRRRMLSQAHTTAGRKQRQVVVETAHLNELTALYLMRRVYLELYELERRQVFDKKGGQKMINLIKTDGGRLGTLTVRQAFARRFIHLGVQEYDFLSAYSEKAHENNRVYVATLRKKGLTAESW